MTTIRIDEVILSDGNIKNGDEKILVEYYYIHPSAKDENIFIVSTSDDSIPMQKNQQYLLFLHESPQPYGDYATAGAWQGKYPITEKTLTAKASDLTAEELGFFANLLKDRLTSLTQQVFDKYLR